MDTEVSRIARLVALATMLQTKRVVTATELAKKFAVSTRTIYRDVRTLESAGIPVVTQEGKGFSMMDGYRLPPVMFSREEAIALLTAEKLASRFTDASTAQLTSAAMDKLRAVLRHVERDHLDGLVNPAIHVFESPHNQERPNTYQQLITAVTARQVVRISYFAGETGELTVRDMEPIGLYLSQHWHVVAFCRLRQAFRDFRLDRIKNLFVSSECFADRPEVLSQYWEAEARRRSREKAVIRFQPKAVIPALVQHLHDTKNQYGWVKEEMQADGSLELTFLIGSLPYMATWLLPFAEAVTVIEPKALSGHLSRLAKRVYDSFYEP